MLMKKGIVLRVKEVRPKKNCNSELICISLEATRAFLLSNIRSRHLMVFCN